MSALPSAVRKQIAKANRVADEYYKQVAAEKSGATPPAGDPPSDVPPAGDPPPAAVAAPAAPAAVAAPVVTAPVVQPLPAEGFETKYKVLQGKYNAEVPRLQGQVRELNDLTRSLRDQVTATQNLLAALGTQPARQPEPAAPATPAAKKQLVTEDEIKQFGPDLYDFIKRAAAQEVLPAVESRVDSRIAPVASKVDQVGEIVSANVQRTARTDKQSVHDLLASQVPNWAQLNEDPLFLEWLDQVDPYSGYRRGQLLEQAYKAYDGPRVVAFFRGYLTENATISPPVTTTETPAPKPQKDLAAFIAPGAPKTGAVGAPDGSGKRAWTRAEIGQFYEDVRVGKYRTKPDEHKRIEADIFAAQRDGRIR